MNIDKERMIHLRAEEIMRQRHPTVLHWMTLTYPKLYALCYDQAKAEWEEAEPDFIANGVEDANTGTGRPSGDCRC